MHNIVEGAPKARGRGPKKGDMAAIDYATCGVNDVIAHSLKLHPQLLAGCVHEYWPTCADEFWPTLRGFTEPGRGPS